MLAILLLVIAVMPVGWLKGGAEAALSRQTGRPVSIVSMERESAISLTPIIRLTGVSVPQAAWAGQGQLASADLLRVQVNVFSLLIGGAELKLLSAKGVTLSLVRDANRRENWRTGNSDAAGPGISLTQLGSLDAKITYKDAFQERSFQISARVDPVNGLNASGQGEIAGNAVKLLATGHAAGEGPWPFALTIRGDALDLRAQGTMSAPFDTQHMRFHLSTRANDLKLVDRIIEAGLFATQPVRLSAQVSRDGPRWTIAALSGTIGSSDIDGHATILKSPEGTKLNGAVHSRNLDFDDLASNAQLAAAAALVQAQGPKVVPNTQINLDKVAISDGRMTFQADHLVSAAGTSALASMSGVLSIKDKLLTVSPLRIGLTTGEITGTVRIDQRGNRAAPLVTLALDVRGSTIGALTADKQIAGPVDGHVMLTGSGDTIREAVGSADGSIALFAGTGSLPTKLASLMAFDVGRALFAGHDDRSELRCAMVRLDMAKGLGTVNPLIIDTSRSQINGQGAVRFPDEQLAITLSGAPKGGSVLRVPGDMLARGTIRSPHVLVPKQTTSVGNILKGIGRAITGRQGPAAVDADCEALRQQALGG